MKTLTDKARVRILKQINIRLAHDLREILEISNKSLEWAEKNGYKRGKKMEQISDISSGALFYLDCRASDLLELDRTVPRDQMKLRGMQG